MLILDRAKVEGILERNQKEDRLPVNLNQVAKRCGYANRQTLYYMMDRGERVTLREIDMLARVLRVEVSDIVSEIE